MSDYEVYKYGWNKKYSSLKKGDKVLIQYCTPKIYNVISWSPSKDTIAKYSKPVLFREGDEIGNDYWYYSQMFPKREYQNFGYNLVYKAMFDSLNNLSFTDACGKSQRIKYTPRNYTAVPDTFLVFRNINENIAVRFSRGIYTYPFSCRISGPA